MNVKFISGTEFLAVLKWHSSKHEKLITLIIIRSNMVHYDNLTHYNWNLPTLLFLSSEYYGFFKKSYLDSKIVALG